VQEAQECHWHLAARAKEVLAQCLEHGNGHEANRGMEAGTQSHGMTGSHAHGHSSQGTMAARSQGREERQSHDREHQEHRR